MREQSKQKKVTHEEYKSCKEQLKNKMAHFEMDFKRIERQMKENRQMEAEWEDTRQ